VDHLGDVHGSRSGARPPIREAITKNVYISPGSGSLDKNTHSFVYYLKKRMLMPTDIFKKTKMFMGVSSQPLLLPPHIITPGM
jgi:hypothetical protein